ncbi:SAM hydrolase/SAM-dependent halogenase family protein [Parasphaerochaeta coccoides]|uniref:DNA-directed RNA polymerase subunit delta n=1 Tax=Parasphaerochaeta coccoides (strain ATCC BAA-1237 / DSM 17374 / SPN1) TaxID=760011 RepID=F4GHK7_PARC1|nr:SAM-dependent chlorinase/fluorinase [Parasphaerochaeta coccoides]AEC02596.1 protein of unknown function DUF62 [Parasphaerochaeta coccoides DSM 17374]
MSGTKKPMLVFQTDFTYKEGAVSAMYGVVKSVDRTLEIIDGSHEIPKYDTWSASYRLFQTVRFWPAGTVFVSVVDPGVGTPRRACVALTESGHYIVTPDNGALTHLDVSPGIIQVREINEKVNRRPASSGTNVFHGRDLFGYCAARLASGIISFEEVGSEYPVSRIVRHPLVSSTVEGGVVSGIFEIGDPNFGNLWTNIPRKQFTQAGFAFGDRLQVTVSHGDAVFFSQIVLFQSSFGYVTKGEPIIYVNEMERIGLALNQDDICARHGLHFGSDWMVSFARP